MAGKSRAGSKRLRLDELLVRRGLALDRKQAAALILRGAVLVENQRVHQAGTQVKADAGLRVKETPVAMSREPEGNWRRLFARFM